MATEAAASASEAVAPEVVTTLHYYDEAGHAVYNYTFADPQQADADGWQILVPGPVDGPIQVRGRAKPYNVSDRAIAVRKEHVGELNHHIGMRHEQDGHPLHTSRVSPDYVAENDEFVHLCTDCPTHVKRTPADQAKEFRARVKRMGGDVDSNLFKSRVEHYASHDDRVKAALAETSDADDSATPNRKAAR